MHLCHTTRHLNSELYFIRGTEVTYCQSLMNTGTISLTSLSVSHYEPSVIYIENPWIVCIPREGSKFQVVLKTLIYFVGFFFIFNFGVVFHEKVGGKEPLL